MSARPHRPPTRALPANPSLDQLKRQAKELLDAFGAGDADARAEVERHVGTPTDRALALHDAQLVLARSYGFDSWPKLKASVDGVTVGRLIDAVRAGDTATVERMLTARPELVHMDVAESDEHQALHHAVLERRGDVVRVLMQHGADANKGIWPHRDATGPRTIALERGYADIVAIIDDEEERRRRTSPATVPVTPDLSAALLRRDEGRIIAFLDSHPEIVERADTSNGLSALHRAAVHLLERTTEYLLARGANPNVRTKSGATPLDMLGSGCDPAEGETARAAAAVARTLLRYGGEPTSRSAIALGDAAALQAHHARQPLTGESGLVSFAVACQRPEMLTRLLELGLDPDEPQRLLLEEVVHSSGSPLLACARRGLTEMARILLEHGANPNTNVYAASTAMHDAHARKDAEMVRTLERHGGTLGPVDMAYLGLTERAAQALEEEARHSESERARSAEGVLQAAADTGNVDLVRIALSQIEWERGDTRWHWMLMRPLGHHAAADRDRYVNCLRALLDRSGADVSGPFGRTLLHDVAAAWPRGNPMERDDRLAFANTLLEYGSRLDVRDDTLKSTPLGWACRWGRTELARLLLDRGADPVEADAEPWATPRAWALKSGSREILTMLDT